MTVSIVVPGAAFTKYTRQFFNPAYLWSGGKLGFYIDPDDRSTLFQDAAGTTPVTAVGQPVGRVMDKSGRGLHFTQGTAGNRPTLRVDSAGFHYLDTTGGKRMETAVIDLSAHRHLAAFIGFQHNNAAQNSIPVLGLSSNTAAARTFFVGASDLSSRNAAISSMQTATGVTAYRFDGLVQAGDNHSLAARFDTQGATPNQRVRPILDGETGPLTGTGGDPGPHDSTFANNWWFQLGYIGTNARIYKAAVVVDELAEDDVLRFNEYIKARMA